ncbi:MAG: hypothetical protein CL693_03380 [Cellvibrionaceae bacterium]|nr:hypothetical protein [Cellvibrionaceae bacterium]
MGKAIALEGIALENAAPLSKGLMSISSDPRRLLEAVFSWSNGQPFLTQKLCQIIAVQKSIPEGVDEVQWVEQIVRQHVVEDWESKDNPEHLRTIRDRVLLDPLHSTVVLSDYSKVLAGGSEGRPLKSLDDSSRLYLSGLIAIKQGRAYPRTKVYKTVFDRTWVDAQLSARRPYAEPMKRWEDNHDAQYLLSGEELQSSQQWAEGKHLPEADHRFLAASQALESQSFQRWNERLQEEVQQRRAAEKSLQEALKDLETAREHADLANRAKTDFLARVSHEVRTPINSVLGLSRLAMKQQTDELGRDYLQKIRRTTNYMLSVVNDIVDVAKVERGELSLNTETFYLDDVIDRLIDIVAPRALEKSLKFELDLPQDNLPLLLGDANRLEQLLLNLVSNSIRHTAEGSICLRITLSDPHNQEQPIHFAVEDSGEGVSDESVCGVVGNHPQSALKPGLGLSLCCELTGLMGGGLVVDSEPSKGSRFTATVRFGCVEREPDIEVLPQSILVCGLDAERTLVKELSQLGHQLSDSDCEADAPLDMVLFDGLDKTLLPAIKLLQSEHSELAFLAALPSGQSTPYHLSDFNYTTRLDYPLSRRALADLINHKGQAGAVAESDELIHFRGNYHVLVVDDDEINLLIVSELLTKTGLQVDLVDDGAKALDRLEQRQYDLVLMDIEMPVMGGLQAVEVLRKQPWGKDVPVVAMTAHALVGDGERFLAAGMNAHLTKPFEPQDLYGVLAHWLKIEEPLLSTNTPDTKSQKPTVLVVDDEPDNIRLMMSVLQEQYTVLAATNGEKALQLAASDKAPSAIILDVLMPGMSGFEVCKALKFDPATEQIPVIFVSGLDSEEHYREGLEMGAVDFLSKPVSPVLLLARLSKLL